MLSILIALRDLRFAFPAGFMLAVVPPVVSTWGVIRLTSGILRLLASPFFSSSSFSKLHRLADDCLYSLYSRLTVFFFEAYSRVEVIFYGDVDFLLRKHVTENVLLLSNHQTTADWMIINILAARVNDWPGPLGRVRYVMKSGLKFLPLIGFYLGTYARGGVFVQRTKDVRSGSGIANDRASTSSLTPLSSLDDADDDSDVNPTHELRDRPIGQNDVDKKNATRKSLDRIRRWRTDNGVATWLVVYPEGTRFDPEDENKISKSQNYAAKNRLEAFEHVLCPRAKAVRDSLMALGSSLDAVYHVTVAYSSTFCDSSTGVKRLKAPSMSNILMGDNPRVHVHLKRIETKDLPADLTMEESSVRCWLHGLFAEADDRLKGFYSLDPGRRGKLLSSSASSNSSVAAAQTGNAIHFAGISIFKTLPTFVLFSLVMAAVLSSKQGRKLYWQSWLLGSPALAAAAVLIY